MTRLALFCSFGLLLTATCLANDAEQRILERYKEILINAPKRGATFDRVYGHYVDIGQSTDLYLDCQKATQEKPNDANAWTLLGLVAERRGRSEEAVEAYNNAAELAPDNFLPMLYLGEVMLNQRRFHEATAALEQANERLKNSTNRIDRRTVLQTLALAYTRFGDQQKSLEVWNQLAALFPNDPDVLIQVAESMEFDGRLDEALQQYRRLITLTDEPFDRVQLSLAAIDIILRQGNDDDALNELNTLLNNLDTENYLAESVRDRIDRIFGRNRDIDRQIEFYQNRIERQPGDMGSLRRLVRTLQRADKIAEAEKLLLDTIRVSPANVALRLMLIDILVERQDIGSAVEQFQAIDRIVPNQTEYLIRWGTLALQNPAIEEDERRAKAAKIWTRIAERSPNDPTALVQIADLFSRHRFSEEAERYYKSAMTLRPNDFSYREHLARFYHQARQKEKVLETLMVGRRPPGDDIDTFESPTGDVAARRSATYLAETGQLLLTLGYHDEAAKILREAAQSQPQNWTLNLRYLESLLRQDTPESAQAVSEIFVNAGKQIENDEQFALFLQQKIQLLRSLQKTGTAIDIVRAELETAPSARLHWHLAALHHAEGNFTAAIAAMEAGDISAGAGGVSPPLEQEQHAQEPGGLRRPALLRFAAELYAQVGDTNKAFELYQQLVQDDPARSGEYWQQIIALHLRRGELPKALEASQNLIGRGVQNAERLRFVADIFLGAQRQAEAVKLLQQALILEPGNTEVLRILAQTFSGSDHHEEAIELLWRLYERHDLLSAKLSVIEMLMDEYRTLGRVDDMITHLQQLSRNYEHRRSAMQALVRAYTLCEDYEEAQHYLEILLDLPEEDKTESRWASQWVLRELVAVAERQDDFAAAVRYQEMLCERSNDLKEHNHLFHLYDKLGDAAKVRNLFFDQILRQGDWQERLDLIDIMIRREQYEIVLQVLDFLEIHEPEHWATFFRRILIEAYQNRPIGELVREFRAKRFDEPVQVSAARQNHDSFLFTAVAPAEFNASLAFQNQFLPVLFYPARHDTGVNPLEEKLPDEFYGVKSLRDARLLSLGLLLREAVNRVRSASNSQASVRQFARAVEELRTMLPADSEQYEVLMDRLRLEIGLLDMRTFDDRFQILPGGVLRTLIEPQVCQQTIRQIVRTVAEGGAADWRRALLYIRALDFLETERGDEELAEYVLKLLDDMNLTAEEFLPPPVPQAAPPPISLARFRMELQGDRPIDRAVIYSLLPDESTKEEETNILSPFEELVVRVQSFRREYRRSLEPREVRPVQQPNRVRMEVTPAEPSGQNPEAELRELLQRLETTHLAGTPAQLNAVEPEYRLNSMAMALLYTRLQQYEKTAAMLDSMELTTPNDLLMREWIISRLAVKYAEPDSALYQRGSEAADRLLNFRLGERERLNLVPVLRHFGRDEEVQRIWDHLAVTVSDRRMLAELFNEMLAAGEPQKENVARIAQRILMNPAFLQNPRRLTSDVLLFQAAFRALQSQNRQDVVVPMLEARFRGLRDKTDSRILLARLYLMLDREAEARALALELAQNPTREPERRQMIVSLLVQFGMQRELEAMNRLLLEGR